MFPRYVENNQIIRHSPTNEIVEKKNNNKKRCNLSITNKKKYKFRLSWKKDKKQYIGLKFNIWGTGGSFKMYM